MARQTTAALVEIRFRTSGLRFFVSFHSTSFLIFSFAVVFLILYTSIFLNKVSARDSQVSSLYSSNLRAAAVLSSCQLFPRLPQSIGAFCGSGSFALSPIDSNCVKRVESSSSYLLIDVLALYLLEYMVVRTDILGAVLLEGQRLTRNLSICIGSPIADLHTRSGVQSPKSL